MGNSSSPMQVMFDEHDIISSAEHTVLLLDHYWEKSGEGFAKHIHSLLSFFREFCDGYHHFKEEQVLFPELENHNDFTLHPLISELKEHHEIFREYTKAIEESVIKKQFKRTYIMLCKYVEELKDHIAAENDELFVIAQSLLSDAELETIYYKFKDIDLSLGEGRKMQLCKLLQNIEEEIGIN
jgi:hemerythrin-like domain-containing protein